LASTGDLITNLTPDLLCTKEMNAVNFTALRDQSIGRERYRRNARRLIKAFGQDLRAEAKDSIQTTTARALQTRRFSTHAARELLTRTEALLDTDLDQSSGEKGHRDHVELNEHESLSDASVDSADEEEEDDETTPDDNFARIRDFVAASNAYACLKDRLLTFVHRPHRLRITNAVGETARDETGRIIHPEVLATFIGEISWTPIHLFTFVEFWDFYLPLLERLKGFVEDKVGERRDWWPLSPRLHPLRPEYCRVQWKSPNGTNHHIDIPWERVESLQEALSLAPVFLSPASFESMVQLRVDCPLRDSGGQRCFSWRLDKILGAWCSSGATNSSTALDSTLKTANATTSPAVAAVKTTLAPSVSFTSTQVPRTPHLSRQPGTTEIQVSSTPETVHRSSYLYLCIQLRDRQFMEIDCGPLQNDLDFFDALKSTYDKTRGPWRRWFSVHQYDHCEFFVFRKWGVKLGGPLYPGDFKPRPPLPQPPHSPINEGEFRDHYYHRNKRPTWVAFFRRTYGYVSSRGANTDALQSLPKRVEQLEVEDEKRELFYGLLAVEVRSGFRMAAYAFVLNSPWIVFLFLWLLPLGHPLDLQGATVPLMISLAAMAVFLAMMTLV
jgi:hypothetical protein